MPQSQFTTKVSFIQLALDFFRQRGHGTHVMLGVRIASGRSYMSSPFSPFRDYSCEKTAWYTIFMFIVCTLLAQVVLTLRFGAFPLLAGPEAAAERAVTGYTLSRTKTFPLQLGLRSSLFPRLRLEYTWWPSQRRREVRLNHCTQSAVLIHDFIASGSIQPKHPHRYLLTHITCVYFPGTEG